MKYIIPIILLIVAIYYIVYYIILKYKYIKGDKLYGIVKDYKKYKKYRLYLLKLSDGNIIDYTTTRFYMLNTKILLSKNNDKYYTKDKIKDILFKTITIFIVTLILFVYILFN